MGNRLKNEHIRPTPYPLKTNPCSAYSLRPLHLTVQSRGAWIPFNQGYSHNFYEQCYFRWVVVVCFQRRNIWWPLKCILVRTNHFSKSGRQEPLTVHFSVKGIPLPLPYHYPILVRFALMMKSCKAVVGQIKAMT